MEQNFAEPLLNKTCPCEYQCKALDCIECIEIHKEGKNDER